MVCKRKLPLLIVKQKRNKMATKTLTKWTRQPQEKEGSYFFAGQFYTTKGVATELTVDEIMEIYVNAKMHVWHNDGADYLMVYTDEQGRKLFFIDNLNKEMIESGQYGPEHDYCTLMFANEY